MYLEYYSIKRFFFFLSFGENFVIFLILTLFVSFGGVGMKVIACLMQALLLFILKMLKHFLNSIKQS
ncbi:hypothetical protein ECC09_03805 [Helicobacter pylori]|nr:hypothetical protein ECC09_03805 [Helicobacter pylori]